MKASERSGESAPGSGKYGVVMDKEDIWPPCSIDLNLLDAGLQNVLKKPCRDILMPLS